VSGWELRSASSASDSNSPKTASISCTNGKKLLGGGAVITGVTDGKVVIIASYPYLNNQWDATAVEASNTGSSWAITAYAICGTVT
jgi:hypothetical protein